MNPVIKEGLKEDIRYTLSMYVYILVVSIIVGVILFRNNGDAELGGNVGFYSYISMFGTFLTSAYCCSKARMDRYFNMGFSRRVFKNQCILAGVIRSMILAVGFFAVSLLCGAWSLRGEIIGAVGNIFRLPSEVFPCMNMVLLFLLAWTVNNHMLVDSTLEKPRASASIYLTSPSIWSFNNNKKAKNRSGNRAVYFIMMVIYVGAALTFSFMLEWFFYWWLLAAVIAGLIILNIAFVCIFNRRIKCIDII